MDSNICRLNGNRVYLSILRDDDFAIAKYIEWMSNESTNVFVEKNTKVLNPSDMPGWIADESDDKMGIVYKETDTLIGFCRIDRRIEAHAAWLSVNIGEESMRGKGIGREVMDILCNYCFNELRVHSIHLDVLESNKSAIACYQKVGFRVSGVYRDHCFHNGNFENWLHMDMLENEFIRL